MYVTARAVSSAGQTGPDGSAGPILLGAPPPEEPEEIGGGGCDCRSARGGGGGGGGPAAWLVLLALLAGWLRFRRATLVVGGLVVGGLVVVISAAGCEKSAPIVSCDTVVEALYRDGLSAAGEDGAALDQAGAAALCHDLELAEGCDPEFKRWFQCLEAARAGDAGLVCPRELLATAACRNGDAYEFFCDDAEDGDDDGHVDCADGDCLDSAWCTLEGVRVDQASDPAVDVLFVVDYHESMAEEHAALGDAMRYLLDQLRDSAGSFSE